MLMGQNFFFFCLWLYSYFFVLVGALTQEVGGKCKATGLNPSINPYQYILCMFYGFSNDFVLTQLALYRSPG